MKGGASRSGRVHLAAQVGEVRGQLAGRLHLAARARAGGTPALRLAIAARRATPGFGAAPRLPAAPGWLGVARDRGLGQVEQSDGEAKSRGEFVEERSRVAGAPGKAVQD